MALLPAEILTKILKFVNNEASNQSSVSPHSSESACLSDIRSCSLVSHHWHSQSAPLLYSTFSHTHLEDSFSKLWHFLRTVVKNPELGAHVKCLEQRFSSRWVNYYDEEDISPQEHSSRQIERQALNHIGARLKLQQLPLALHRQTRALFIAILMMCLPKVSTLRLSVHNFHMHDPEFFTVPFWQALESATALRNIKKVTLFDVYRYLDNLNEYFEEPPVYLKGLERTLTRAGIKKLELVNLELNNMALESIESSAGTSSTTNLTITCSPELHDWIEDPEPEDIEHRGLKAGLELPRALVSLTLQMKTMRTRLSPRPHQLIDQDDLWRVLGRHKHSLVYLELFDEDVDNKELPPELDLIAPMGRLNQFNRLSVLHIQPRMLLRDFNNILEAPYRLRNALPPFLQSLTFYNLPFIRKDIQTEIMETLTETTLLQSLRYFLLQGLNVDYHAMLRQDDELSGQMATMQQAFAGRDITFWHMPQDDLAEDGTFLDPLLQPDLRRMEAQEALEGTLQRV